MLRSPTPMRLQLDGPVSSSRRAPSTANCKAARLRRRSRHQLLAGAQPHHQKLWRRPKISPAELDQFLEFNQSNRLPAAADSTDTAAADAPTKEDRRVNWLYKYHTYRPTRVTTVYDSDLPVHYWFYIFTHSSELNLILRPFKEANKKWPADKRLLCVMRRNGVKFILKDLELYKSLPRRIVVIKAPDWNHLLSALADLELTLPDMMKYASYPLLLDADSSRYPSTSSGVTTIFSRAGTLS